MSYFIIKKSLETHLLAMPSALPTAFENTEFTPPEGQPYQGCYLIPTAPDNTTYGDNFHRERGFFRVELYYPADTGAGPCVAKAQAIRDWFKRGTSFVEGDTTVIVGRTPAISTGSIENDKYVLAVDINYFANVC